MGLQQLSLFLTSTQSRTLRHRLLQEPPTSHSALPTEIVSASHEHTKVHETPGQVLTLEMLPSERALGDPQRRLLESRLLIFTLCLAENSPGHGKSTDHRGRVSSLLHKPEFPDGEMMEVLI